MIRVVQQPRPADFDTLVEQPGRELLEELREQRGGTLEGLVRDDLKPVWRAGSALLGDSYRWICAYAAMRISRTTGQPSVDHFAPKSSAPELAYEWTNYRLACQLMNARKRDYLDVLDPFEIHDDWFELDLDTYLLQPGEDLPVHTAQRVLDTIRRLKLNEREEHVEERRVYVKAALAGETSPAWLRTNAPFIYKELVRLGRISAASN